MNQSDFHEITETKYTYQEGDTRYIVKQVGKSFMATVRVHTGENKVTEAKSSFEECIKLFNDYKSKQ
jgi:hypothetical protein